ncbi:MAG: ABC transporter ATP-binding protein [Candidatus Bathyarchaeota archaeon]|nr:ABC transporter ATP-binding protein [Candidatus Bathyarchaeota archaeon]
MEKETAVITSSLRKEYDVGDVAVQALKGVNLEVVEGEFITLYGPSGAGKTTLLNMIGGLDQPSGGVVEVFGHNLAKYDEDFLATFRCAYIGYVFQSYNLISTLTTLENIAFPMQLAKWDEDRVEKRSEKLLMLVGLVDRANHFPSQLSGGELQRAAFARALANDPPLFLVDEPTGNLDLDTGLKIIGILEELKEGKTLITVTHDERILKLADRTLVMADGRIVSGK